MCQRFNQWVTSAQLPTCSNKEQVSSLHRRLLTHSCFSLSDVNMSHSLNLLDNGITGISADQTPCSPLFFPQPVTSSTWTPWKRSLWPAPRPSPRQQMPPWVAAHVRLPPSYSSKWHHRASRSPTASAGKWTLPHGFFFFFWILMSGPNNLLLIWSFTDLIMGLKSQRYSQ